MVGFGFRDKSYNVWIHVHETSNPTVEILFSHHTYIYKLLYSTVVLLSKAQLLLIPPNNVSDLVN